MASSGDSGESPAEREVDAETEHPHEEPFE